MRYPRSWRGARCPAGKPLAASAESWPAPVPDGAFDLAGFLSGLDDGKLRHLQEEVQREARRRGWMRKAPKPSSRAKPSLRRRATGRRSPPGVESPLTKGQERLASAALAAGASPGAVARELGIGRVQVAKLASALKMGRPLRV